MKFLNERGFTLIEVMTVAAVTLISLLASSVFFSNTLSQFKYLRDTEDSLNSSLVIVTPILDSSRAQIETLCTQLGAWTSRASRCASVDFTQPAAQDISVVATPSFPAYRDALGIDLRRLKMGLIKTPVCVDITRCQRVLSDNVLELTFEYRFQPKVNGSQQTRFIKVRKGSEG